LTSCVNDVAGVIPVLLACDGDSTVGIPGCGPDAPAQASSEQTTANNTIEFIGFIAHTVRAAGVKSYLTPYLQATVLFFKQSRSKAK